MSGFQPSGVLVSMKPGVSPQAGMKRAFGPEDNDTLLWESALNSHTLCGGWKGCDAWVNWRSLGSFDCARCGRFAQDDGSIKSQALRNAVAERVVLYG